MLVLTGATYALKAIFYVAIFVLLSEHFKRKEQHYDKIDKTLDDFIKNYKKNANKIIFSNSFFDDITEDIPAGSQIKNDSILDKD